MVFLNKRNLHRSLSSPLPTDSLPLVSEVIAAYYFETQKYADENGLSLKKVYGNVILNELASQLQRIWLNNHVTPRDFRDVVAKLKKLINKSPDPSRNGNGKRINLEKHLANFKSIDQYNTTADSVFDIGLIGLTYPATGFMPRNPEFLEQSVFV